MPNKICIHDDFMLLEQFINGNGNPVPVPECNWRISYYTDSFIKYHAEHTNGVFRNCRKAGENQVLVSMDNHLLGIGILKHTLELDLDNALFGDGKQNIFLSGLTGYELIEGETTAKSTEITSLPVNSFLTKLITEFTRGEAGITPHIGRNGNWWTGDKDTGVPAAASGMNKYPSYLNFPLLGVPNVIYLDTEANKLYRWDETKLHYYVIGSDYNDIKIINGGTAEE